MVDSILENDGESIEDEYGTESLISLNVSQQIDRAIQKNKDGDRIREKMANKERMIREEKLKKDPERKGLLESAQTFLSGLGFSNPKVESNTKQATVQKAAH